MSRTRSTKGSIRLKKASKTSIMKTMSLSYNSRNKYSCNTPVHKNCLEIDMMSLPICTEVQLWQMKRPRKG